MVRVDLKGIAKVTTKGRTYYYAWRGGPRLRGEPGSPEFHRSYNEALESRRTPDTGRFQSLVTLYKASNDYSLPTQLGRIGRVGLIALPTILASFVLLNLTGRRRYD